MKRSKMTKRILAVVLSLSMIMSNMTVTAADLDNTDSIISTVVETVADSDELGTEDIEEIVEEMLEDADTEESEEIAVASETVTLEEEEVAKTDEITSLETNEASASEVEKKVITSEAVFSPANEEKKTYKESFVDKTGFFTVHATGDNSGTVVIETNTTGTYDTRLKTGGAGNTAKRSIEFETSDAAVVTAYVRSSTDNAERTLILADSKGATVDSKTFMGEKSATEITLVANEAGTYYLWSASSGINFYEIKVDIKKSNDESGEDDNQPAVPGEVTATGDIYVAPNATGNGSEESPADFVKALEALTAGHTIHMAAGTYEYDEPIIIKEDNSGTAAAKKSVIADGEVVIDFAGMNFTNIKDNATDKANRGIILDGSYWHFKGLTITHASDNGMLLSGNNNVIELCEFVNNHDTGLQISRYQTNKDSISEWPSNNLILNCTSHDNVDATGENADGFAAKLTCGEGNVFDGCMSYNNSDDGWDLYAKTETGPIGSVTIKNCIAFRNGTLSDGSGTTGGDMNGFKLGGSGVATPHVVMNCIAFENGAHGFTDNNNPAAIKLISCTSFNNSVKKSGKANFQMDRELGGVNINLLSFNTSRIGSDAFVGTLEDSIYFNSEGKYFQVANSKKFDGKEKIGTQVTISSKDFASLSAPTSDFHKAWRNSDGSLNTGDFLKVTSSSELAKLASDGGTLGSRIAEGVKMDQAPENTNNGTIVDADQNDEENVEKPVLPAASVAHNFTTDGLNSDVFTISGNLSTSKGTVVYNGETLTQCLKMESSTSIKFSTSEAATLILVFNDGVTAPSKVDGKKIAAVNGIITVELAAGDHEITKGDSANLFYIALSYSEEEKDEEIKEEQKPALPEVEVIPAVNGKIDAWDFGAEKLDESVYNNMLTEEIINSWYPGTEPGTKGVPVPSFSVKDANGNILLAFDDGTYSATHRIRTTNTNLSRHDEKSLKNVAGDVAYTGYIYSNKAATESVNLQLACTAGDIVTIYAASNGTDSEIVFKAPSGKADSKVHTLGGGTASEMTFYAGETGLYKIYSATEKLVVARITVEHTQEVNVIGYVDVPESLVSDYSLVFECKETGAKTKAKVENGTYKVVLNENHSYVVSLENANGYIVSSESKLSLEKNACGENSYKQFDIEISSVELVNVEGDVMNIDEATLAKAKISLSSNAIYVPEIIYDGFNFKVQLEKGVKYTITVEGIDDYELNEYTWQVDEDCKLSLCFSEKDKYEVTIDPVGASLEDLKDAEFTFIRHSDADVTAEENYKYTFKGTDEITLRNGVYTVKVDGVNDYKQKLTSNVVVKDAPVTKTIGFEFTGDPNQPKTWDFSSAEYTGQPEFSGAVIVNGSKHGAQYGMANKNGSITVPVKGNSRITIEVGYSWDIIVDGEEILQNPNGGVSTLTYSYEGAAGDFVIATGTQATSYIKSVTVTPVSETEVELPTSWDFRTDAYTGQSEYNGLSITNGKKHGSTYGMQITNGTITVPIKGACTVKVSVGYNWDVTIDGFQGERFKDKTNSGDIDLTYEYSGNKGVIEIKTGSEFTSYIKAIETVYAETGVEEAEDIVISVGPKKCDYTTINDALAAVRKMNRNANQRVIISIEPGNYEEMLVVDVANVTLKNASSKPSIETKNKGVDIDDNAVRITSYYGHGYTYYSMGNDCKYNEELLAVNKENGYPSYVNPGSGTTDGSYWNATVVIKASGFEADGIIFENSFNQYVSEKAANDIIVKQSGAKEGTVARASMKVGDTTVQDKKYVERAAALAIYNNVDKTFFNNCKFIGRQDTLYGGTGTKAAFYDCDIYGGTDYIFGGMTAVFAKCNLVANTMEDGNDTFYITAAQQKSGRGYLMYNCTVTSTKPGVDTASKLTSKAGYLGRPWEPNTSEVVFYATIVEASNDYRSLIEPAGWLSTLGGTSDNVYEFGTYEYMEDVDNDEARVSWAKTYANAKNAKLADGTPVTVEAFLGEWDAFAGKDMIVSYPTTKVVKPEESDNTDTKKTVYKFDATELTASQDKEAITSGTKLGTEDYFAVAGDNTVKRISSSTQKVTSIEIAKAEGSSVDFTVSGKADVVLGVSSTGGTNKSTIALKDAAGNVIANAEGLTEVSGTAVTTLTYIGLKEGKYSIVSPENANYNRGTRILTISVEEEVPQGEVTETHVFDYSTLTAAKDKEEIAKGTKFDNYFETVGSSTVLKRYDAEKGVTSVEVAKNETSGFQFVVEGKATAIVTASSTGSSNASTVGIVKVNEDGTYSPVVNKEGIDTVSGTGKTTLSYENLSAGKYIVLSPKSDLGRGARVYTISVTETKSGTSTKPERANWTTVALPEITKIELDSKDAGKINVTVQGLVGYDGADKLTVVRYDERGRKIDEAVTETSASSLVVSFTPDHSGVYTFRARLDRAGERTKSSLFTKDFDFSLPLAKPFINSATSKGNGSIEICWGSVKEAETYLVKVSTPVLMFFSNNDEYVTKETSIVIDELVVGKTYEVTVTALRGDDKSAISDAKSVEATQEANRTWAFSAFGSSVNTTNNGYSGNLVEDGKVTVYSEGGKGKLVPGSTDGLAFYYTAIDPERENFTLTADVHVDGWKYSNGQEGFGLMAADAVGEYGNGTAFWNNSYQLVSSKIEYYHDGNEVTTDTKASKITMKLGLGYTTRLGVTAQDVKDIASSKITLPVDFTTESGTLETSAASKGAGTYNLVGNASGSTGDLPELLTDFKLQIQRNNTGYILRYLAEDGSVINEKIYYDLERTALTKIDEDNIYVGFFASRNARITVSNVELTTINPADDEAVEDRVIQEVYPVYTVESATNANAADYKLVYYGNADATVTITAEDGTVIADKFEVEAKKKYSFDTKLNLGENKFDLTVKPVEGFKPSEYEVLKNYDEVSFSHVVNYKTFDGQYIYVAANGKATNTGSENSPVDIYSAVKYAAAGQTIVLAAEKYNLTSTVKTERGINGTSEAPINMISNPRSSQRAVLDFGGRCAGMVLAGDYWYFKGFDVTNSQDSQKGIQVSGNNNILDQVNAYRNGNTGIQISRYLGTDEFDQWPANNLILNCSSYLNADKGYEDADGFAAKLTVGNGNVFDGCIAAYNADDGWDLFAKVQSGSIGAVTIKNCVTFKNGYVIDSEGKEINAGNGNGFKMGGDSMSGNHVLENSIAFANKAKGFDSNSCPDIKVYNSTSFDNESYNVAFYTNIAGITTDFEADGILSIKTSNNIAENLKLQKQQTEKVYGTTNYFYNGSKSVNVKGAKASLSWFENVDLKAVCADAVERMLTNTFGLIDTRSTVGITRNADGTINTNDYLKLTSKAKAGAVFTGGPYVPENTTPDSSDSTASDSSSEASAIETTTEATTETTTEITTEITTAAVSTSNAPYIAANVDIEKVNGIDTITTVISRDFILRMKTYELYHSQMINVMVNMPGLVGVSFMTNEVPIGAKDINLTYTKSTEEGFAAGFDTYKYTFKYPTALQFILTFHMNVGTDYIGKPAYIFVYNTKTKHYEIKSTMFVNEIGNVAVSLDELSRVMVLIAE